MSALSADQIAAEMERHRRFCWHVAGRQARRLGRRADEGLREELAAAALAGLWEGLTRFDTSRGTQPLTYAAWYALRAAQERLGEERLVGAKTKAPWRGHSHDPAEERSEAEWLSALVGLGDAPEADDPDRPDPLDVPADFWDQVATALKPSEWLVVRLRYRDGHSWEAVGAVLGLSRERCRQIAESAFDRLRQEGWLWRLAA